MFYIITHILHAFDWKSQSFLGRGEYKFGVRFNILSYCLLQKYKMHRKNPKTFKNICYYHKKCQYIKLLSA